MEIIRQLGLIIGFGYAGEVLARLLPFRLPAGVLGIILVLSALSLRILRPRHLGATADFISANMAFFFLPLAVAILQNYEAIRPVLFQITAICLISTLVTFAVSYGTVHLLRIRGGGSLPPAAKAGAANPVCDANASPLPPLRGSPPATPPGQTTAGQDNKAGV